MKRQILYCSLVYLLILLPRDNCATARLVPFRDEKDLAVLDNQSSQQLQTSQVDFTAAFQNAHSKKQFENESIKANASSINGGVDQDEIMEGEELGTEGRELITHIDYAGATTHPPNEPPKKKSPSTPKSLRSKPRGH
jgi:hypothetical protein